MSRLDVIIFGATGFTGKNAVKELCRISKNYPGMTWGVAGRSEAKLDEILKEISKKTDDDLSQVKKVIADVSDEKSLKEMCAQCKVLVNCCGPYRHYGEPVVRAAIDSKCHYVDVSGEPQFMEKMQLEYDKQARDAGVYIISACGFDSIPNDLGVIFLQKNFGGTLNSVESYLATTSPDNANGMVNYGTWESLVYGLAHYNELPVLRKKLYPEPMPPFKPKLKPRSVIHRRGTQWCLPFPGADASVVYRTQRHLFSTEKARPAQIKTYVAFPNLFTAVFVVFSAAVLFLLSKWRCTRGVLLRYPELFSLGAVTRTGPNEAAMNEIKFHFTLRGEGWSGSDDTQPPNKKMTVMVSGVNPGYGATVVALLFSALTILHEKDKMPACGVITPGVAFRNTNIIQHLIENNLKFEVVNTE